MAQGSCLCGAIRYEITDTPLRMNICHCSMCRKVTGSAYGVFAHVHGSKFRWLTGQPQLSQFESSAENHRAFCGQCGSNMPNTNGDYVCIPAGSFDESPGTTPELQIFAGSKADWHPLADSPISYDEFDPD